MSTFSEATLLNFTNDELIHYSYSEPQCVVELGRRAVAEEYLSLQEHEETVESVREEEQSNADQRYEELQEQICNDIKDVMSDDFTMAGMVVRYCG